MFSGDHEHPHKCHGNSAVRYPESLHLWLQKSLCIVQNEEALTSGDRECAHKFHENIHIIFQHFLCTNELFSLVVVLQERSQGHQNHYYPLRTMNIYKFMNIWPVVVHP